MFFCFARSKKPAVQPGFLKAFREKIRKAHPDAGGSAQEFKEARGVGLVTVGF